MTLLKTFKTKTMHIYICTYLFRLMWLLNGIFITKSWSEKIFALTNKRILKVKQKKVTIRKVG
jgi:hypothetical protein